MCDLCHTFHHAYGHCVFHTDSPQCSCSCNSRSCNAVAAVTVTGDTHMIHARDLVPWSPFESYTGIGGCCRLAAETLAGLNTVQPRLSADHPKPAPSSLDSTPGNDSPAAARKLSKQLADSNRKQKRRLAQVPKPATASHVTTAAAAHAGSGGASVHPILGFSVPHSRRSYHRDTHVMPTKQRSSAMPVHPETRRDLGDFRSSAAAAPAAGRQRKPNTAAPHARSAFARSDLPRVASDSSLTVSADST